MKDHFKEVKDKYRLLIISHFVRYDYDLRQSRVNKAVSDVIMSRIQFGSVEEAIKNLFPPKE